jgi:hypothetical protein
MATSITDGTGKGYAARIDDEGRLYTRTTSESEIEHAAANGRAFNINTEFLTVSSSGENALLYVKNNENVDVVVAAWFVGTGIAGGTNTQASLMRVYTNPTAGTLIASASAVTAVNRRLGDNRTIDVDAYKGGDGYTITGQDATPVLYQTQGNNSRNFGTVYLTLPKGSSLAVTYEPNGAQPIEIYTGFQVYKADVEGVE